MFQENIKSKLVLLIIALAAVFFLSWGGDAQPGSVSVKFQIKYLEFDDYNNGFRLHVNVSTNAPGHLTYVEEYYYLEGSYPVYVSSSNFDGGDLVKVNKSYNASFDILRPTGFYNMVKSVLLLDGSRIFEYWLANNKTFIDNTAPADDGTDALLAGIRNVDRYEIEEKMINSNTAVAFNYKTLGDVSEVDITGSGNDDVSLKVELLKGRDASTADPGVPVYRYFDIRSDSVHIQNISVEYRVENAWMSNRSISANVRLTGWDAGSKIWRVLPTNITDKDSEYTYYVSRSDVLTQFAIIGLPVKKPKMPALNATKTPAVTVKPKNNTVSATPVAAINPPVKSVSGFGYVMALISLILTLILIFRIKRRK